MKLNDLHENIRIFDEDDFLQYVDNKCKHYLSMINPDLSLWRGENKNQNYIHRELPEKRKPTDMPKVIHEIIDKWFDKNFHIRFRSQAVMMTGNINLAKMYGTLYEIFPVGKFDFVWSPHIKDLYMSLGKFFKSEHGTTIGSFHRTMNRDAEKYQQPIFEFLDDAGYQSTDLKSAIQSGNEIMIHGDYYGLKFQKKRDADLFDDIDQLKEKY